MLEYGLLVGLIAVVAIAAVTTMGTTLQGFFSDANTQLQ
jgi:Flp pilus assembly pilin Flp